MRTSCKHCPCFDIHCGGQFTWFICIYRHWFINSYNMLVWNKNQCVSGIVQPLAYTSIGWIQGIEMEHSGLACDYCVLWNSGVLHRWNILDEWLLKPFFKFLILTNYLKNIFYLFFLRYFKTNFLICFFILDFQ